MESGEWSDHDVVCMYINSNRNAVRRNVIDLLPHGRGVEVRARDSWCASERETRCGSGNSATAAPPSHTGKRQNQRRKQQHPVRVRIDHKHLSGGNGGAWSSGKTLL